MGPLARRTGTTLADGAALPEDPHAGPRNADRSHHAMRGDRRHGGMASRRSGQAHALGMASERESQRWVTGEGTAKGSVRPIFFLGVLCRSPFQRCRPLPLLLSGTTRGCVDHRSPAGRKYPSTRRPPRQCGSCEVLAAPKSRLSASRGNATEATLKHEAAPAVHGFERPEPEPGPF